MSHATNRARRRAAAPAFFPLFLLVGLALAGSIGTPIGCALLGGPGGMQAAGEGASGAAATPMRAPRQLTFAGRRSGEGYFDREGDRLIFQSEREPGNPFYQIYLLDLASGESERLSPGRGKTTCAYFHPSGEQVLFSSTHLDPDTDVLQEAEIAERLAGHSKRYAWDYDEHYDIFTRPIGPDRAAGDGTKLQRLTRARGYDAEAAYSPDGQRIVFASNRHAFREGDGALVVDEALYARDPAQFIDLYVMDADGENVRRLTEHPGYDGGPFFTPDGERIIWRRFSEDGARAEIYSMRSDGSDVRQLTRLGVMSWAPFPHPSGDYVVFATNRHGMENFELYLARADGGGEPVRVTDAPGFDGLPVFSPRGDALVWTSNRTHAATSQLFWADWDDALAREMLGLPAPRDGETPPVLPLPASTSPGIDEADLRAHVEALASDVTEGRLAGTPGERIATDYVARAFSRLGIEPAGDDGTYFEEFDFTAGVSLGESNALRLAEAPTPADGGAAAPRDFALDRDWRPYAFSAEGAIEPSEVVFAGYGIVAPATEGQRAIDAYADLEVRDRWVLVFRYVPVGLSPESRQHLHRYSSIRYKAMLARDRGARGLLVVSGPNSKVREQLAPLRFDVSLSGASIAALSITDATADALLAPVGRSLAELQDRADRSSREPGFVLEGVRVAARVELIRERRTGRNVLGRLRLGDAPSTQTVLIGAHVDHLGHGEGADSLARPEERNAIHPGADDNASGVAALLEIAEAAARQVESGTLRAPRDLVFAAWSGEELGLLGSAHHTLARIDPHAEEPQLGQQIAAYLNMDMVGRMNDRLSLLGLDSSPVWPAEIERANVPIGLPIQIQGDAYLPTDATSFYLHGVPILSAFTGAHSEYHTPRDTPERLDYARMADIARLFDRVALSLVRRPEPPEYVATSKPESGTARGGIRVYLGTIPDYAQTDVPGVVLSGVGKGGPAERAGVRGGDVIVELAGRAIENLYDYTYALEALEIDVPVSLVVLRDGERIALEVVPSSRD